MTNFLNKFQKDESLTTNENKVIDLNQLKNNILSQKIKYKDRRKYFGKPECVRILDNEKSFIIKEYLDGKSCRELSKLCNRPHSTISRVLKRNGYKVKSSNELSRKWNLDENYFETIDCHKKAYWLGWLMSDGSISRNGKEIRIKLQIRDKYILGEFAKDIKYNKPLKISVLKRENLNKNSLIYKCGKKDEYIYCELRISSAKMVLDLAKYGIIWNKGNKNAEPKNIPRDFISSFILGEFEGDGSFINAENKYAIIFIWDNENVCKYIKSSVDTLLNRDIGKVFKRKNSNVFQYRIGKQIDVIQFCNLIYKSKDFNFSLKRKFDKFVNFLKIKGVNY